MLRWLYVLLLRLHPAPFRQRFGDEMLEIFESTSGRYAPLVLVGDGLASLIRQWALRSEFRRPAAAAIISDAPLFRTIDSYKPRSSALLHGGCVAATIFYAGVTAIHHGVPPASFLIGSYHHRPRLLPVAGASVAGMDLNTTIQFGSTPQDPWRVIASVYFKQVRALGVLDANGDLIISYSEMAAAPAALRSLDMDHDGKLSAEECGFHTGTDSKTLPEVVTYESRDFMRRNPVLAALDSNQDGQVSAIEIATSSRALKTLDRNRDGNLAPKEVIPDQTAIQAGMIMLRFDRNDDGIISETERTAGDTGPLRDLLDNADRDRDGVITRQELKDKLRFHDEMRRVLDGVRASGAR